MIKSSHIQFLLLIIISVGFPHLSASQPEKINPTTDVRVLVDMSGSMKQNDPENLRIPAVQLMSNLLPPKSQAGVWTFGEYVNMLVPLGVVDNQWKKHAVAQAKKINSLGLFTNIGGAMEHASYGWTKPQPEIKRSLILLTDGMVDVSADEKENAVARRKVLRELLPRYKAAGITIHTIALSGDADGKLLSELAAETDGWYQKVANASELQRVFLKIFEQATERDSVPLKDNQFSIDDQVEEFTVLVFKKTDSKPTVLEQPDGEAYDASVDNERLSWFEAPDYDLITINKPMVGQWRVFADMDPDNRVLVVSNLSLKTSTVPNNLLANEKFVFRMQLLQDKTIIDKQDLLKLVTMEAGLKSASGSENSFILADNGKGVDDKAEDGIYSIELMAPSSPGITQISAGIVSPTFQRMRQQATNIFESPVTVKENVSTDENATHTVLFIPVKGVSKADSLKIMVEVQLPDTQQLSLTAEPVKGFTQAVQLPVVKAGGNYLLKLDIQGETPAGREFHVKPPAYQFSTESREPVFEKEPELVEEDVPEETAPEETEQDKIEDDVEVVEEESNIYIWLSVGLVINIFLLVLGWFVFKMMKKQNSKHADKMSEQLE
ncbi:MAG: VWA domain-containing protein [Gammaproteobacteria bacterium]|nr:VWA domain-containing protein [Gammaproteobacteria bacterium]